MGQRRTYRRLVQADQLAAFQVMVKETDLMIHAGRELKRIARELILEQRRYLEAFIDRHPEFAATLQPWQLEGPAPAIVTEMTAAAEIARVGPMAAVAGAMAQRVGQGLLEYTDEVIVENGGDTFIQTKRSVNVGIFAGDAALSLRFGLRIPARDQPVSVCTSSGTIGHSLSMGRADAVCVVCRSAAVADAVATSLGNRVQSAADIGAVIEIGKRISGIQGLVVIVDDQIGFWGSLELVPLAEKKVEFSQ